MQVNSRNIFLILFSVIVFIMLIYTEDNSSDNQKFKWDKKTSTFSKTDKNPYGAFAVFESLKDLFPDQTVKYSRRSIYEVYQNSDGSSFNYIFINHSFIPNQEDTDALLEFVYEGGVVFIAAEQYGQVFRDEIGINTNFILLNNDSISLNFTSSQIRRKKDYAYHRQTVPHYFTEFNQEAATVLVKNDKEEAVLIHQPFGDGAFYLCSTPVAFTNYHLLYHDNHSFIAKSLSFLPVQDVYWDEYYKLGREASQSPLRFILSRRSLRTAFYLALITLLIFVIFEGKRKQRIIPIIPPLKNDTLEFANVIGHLYFNHKNHKDLASKKIIYFLDYIRQHYYLKTTEWDEEFYEKLATKTNIPKNKVKQLFILIQRIPKSSKITEKELLDLHNRIEEFKERKISV